MPKTNQSSKAPLIAVIIALTGLIPAVTGLVSALSNNGEEKAELAYQLLQQHVNEMERASLVRDGFRSEQIAELRAQLRDSLENISDLSMLLQDVRLNAREERVAAIESRSLARPVRSAGAVAREGEMETAMESLDERLITQIEQAGEMSAEPAGQPASVSLPTSLEEALRE